MSRSTDEPTAESAVLEGSAAANAGGAPHRIHCSYHKCLTVYFGRVAKAVFNRCLPWRGRYRHFNSHLDDFWAHLSSLRVASVNNRALDLDRLGSFRITRFLRDPRDLVVSGYFYHRRGAEPWTQREAPSSSDWYFANGHISDELRASGLSFSDYLQSLPEEEGLLAELDFRTHHFESMAAWPTEHPDILTFRYEEILADGPEVFRRLFEFYRLGRIEPRLAAWFAERYSLKGRKGDPHIRNPKSGQWRQHFTPRVRREFDRRWGALVRQLGYPTD